MSKNSSQEQRFMRRSMIISTVAIALFSILIALMVLRWGPVGPFLAFIGPVISGVLAILVMVLIFIGLVILFGNLREYYGEAVGWFEIFVFLIIVVVIAFVGFSWLHALLTGLLCIGVIYYLHAAQD
ncbi:MAG: hypothetical protein ACFE9D_02160 [Promethearchaeota archaeon]